MDIKQYNFDPKIVEYLIENNISIFTDIQKQTIPLLIKYKNVAVESPTGTGKTLAFLLPILKNIELNKNQIQAIIFVPTKELGLQISKVLEDIKKFISFSTCLISNSNSRLDPKHFANVDIVISTPEKFSKVFENKKADLSHLKYLIIDEIDMVVNFDMFNFIKDFIAKRLDKIKITIGLFSATFPLSTQKMISKEFGGNIRNIIIKNQNKNIEINVINAFNNDKEKALWELLNKDYINPYFCIIFTRTTDEATEIFQMLIDRKIKKIQTLSSKTPSRERNKIQKQISNGDIVFLVTTDLMARGIDIKGVTHIINYSPPSDINYYIHRIGRTNRFDYDGVIYDIISDEDWKKYNLIKSKYNWLKFNKHKLN